MSAPESEPLTETTGEGSELAERVDTSIDVAVEDEDPSWAQIDAFMPEGSGD